MEDNNQDQLTLRIGKRIAEIAVLENLNQKALAEKLGVSQGFLSSVINNQKIPGSEFLYTLKRVLGISADWVLTGEGSMYGGSKINVRLQKEIQLYLAIARAAVVDGNQIAKNLLSLIKENRLQSLASEESVKSFLSNVLPQNHELELITAIYNSNLWVNDPEVQRQNIVAAALEYFELKAPVDILNPPKAQTDSNVQINVGVTQRNVQGNYYER